MSNYAVDTSSKIEVLFETGYLTVSNGNVQAVFPQVRNPNSPYRGALGSKATLGTNHK